MSSVGFFFFGGGWQLANLELLPVETSAYSRLPGAPYTGINTHAFGVVVTDHSYYNIIMKRRFFVIIMFFSILVVGKISYRQRVESVVNRDEMAT